MRLDLFLPKPSEVNSSPKILGGEPAAVLLDRIRAEREQTSTPKQRGKTTKKNSSQQLSINLE
jgi:hypothetical protein